MNYWRRHTGLGGRTLFLLLKLVVAQAYPPSSGVWSENFKGAQDETVPLNPLPRENILKFP